MTCKDNSGDGTQESSDVNKPVDIWYKLRSAGGIATAIVVAIIGTIGSYVINNQQTLSTRAQLYTQLMSQRENAESAVRKDMFEQVLSSFLTEKPDSQCILDQIDDDLLRLELLSRNFHEMLDMEPLFLHVLLKIVREIHNLPRPATKLYGKEESPAPLKNERFYALYQLMSEDMDWEEFTKTMMIKKLDRLIKIARRITKKQMESLSSVQSRYRLTIDLSKTCQNACPTESVLKECDDKTEGEVYRFSMKLNDDFRREFKVTVKYSYPLWSQVRIKVEVQKTENEKNADINGSGANIAEFWLGYFDFPLAENTFLSDKERYAVVLDEIDKEKNEAHVSFLYFPASYAGLKEKSFYQQRLISTLLEGKSF